VTDRKKRAQFERLLMPHLDAAYNFARWFMRHPQDAEDMVQEAYLKAYRSFNLFKGGNVKAWLFTILRNTCLTLLARQNKSRKVIDFNDAAQRHGLDHPGPEVKTLMRAADMEFSAEADKNRIHQALLDLPEHYRIVLVLREFEDLGYRQIAEILDVPVGTVMSRLSRARSLLKSQLIAAECEGLKNEL